MSRRRFSVRGRAGRDKEVIRFLYGNKVTSVDQLRQRFFQKHSHQYLYQYLKGLRKAKLIRRFGVYRQKRLVQAFETTSLGFELAVRPVLSGVVQRQLRSDSIEHDLSLVDIRLWFENNPKVLKYVTENDYQTDSKWLDDPSTSPLIEFEPDALYQVDLQGEIKWLPLEFESTCKSKERQQKKLVKYYSNSEIYSVLYIVGNKKVRKWIQAIDREISGNGQESKVEIRDIEKFNCISGNSKVSDSNGNLLEVLKV